MFRLLSRIKLQMLLAIVLAVPSIAMAGTANAEPDATGTFAGKLLANCEYRYSGDSSNSTVYCPDTVSIGSNAGQSFTGVLKFDLSGFSGTVLEADLELFVTNNYANDEGSPELTIYKYNGSWAAPDTTPVTDALPAFYGGMHSRTFNITGKDGEWVKFNIAPLVRDSIAKGENELVLALAGSWAEEGMRFFHYLSFNTLVPKLNIAYTTSPIQLPSPQTRIAAGNGFTLSLQDDGTVKAYGWINGSKIEVPDNLTDVQAVYASNDCGYAIRAGGIVKALGDGCTVPAEVPNGNVVGLVLDGNAPAVLKNDGTIISWGSGQFKIPVEWENIHAPFKSVSGGYNHAAALTWDDDVVSWGSVSMGATDVPEDLPETTAIASGLNHSLALLKDGTVRLWGYYRAERPPEGLSNVGAIYANNNYSVAVLKDSGEVVVWGDYGLLQPPAGLRDVIDIAAGRDHIVALKSDGTLVGWGKNQHGETVNPAPPVGGLSWLPGSEIGTTKATIADENLHDEHYGDLTLRYRIGAAGSVRQPYAGEDPADYGFDTELQSGDELAVSPGQHIYVVAEYEEEGEDGIDKKIAYWSDVDPVVAGAPPTAPNVSADDASNTIIGLTTAMEYQIDGGAYVRYDGTSAPDLTGAHTVKVRVAADPATGTPAGAAATLSFTSNPPAPAAPNVSADDASNTIIGITTAMEYQIDSGAYVRYDGTNAPDLTSAHTVKVRVAADPATGTPAGADTTLSFTPPSTPDPSTSTPSASQDRGVDVLVNGKVESIGAATTSTRLDQTVTTVIVDEHKLEQKLAAEGQKSVVTIPVNTKFDVVIGELSGRMIQSMEQKQAVIEIKTDKATYTIPAQQINMSSISEQLGKTTALQDINVQIEIAAPNENTVKLAESAAQKGDFSIIVPSIDFIIRAASGDKKIEITNFEAYVERTIAIPDGVDPNKITTGIVVEPDGSVRHVPTQVVVIGNQYFAKVNSLTNSTYSLVYHPVTFVDVDRHWAKTAVNDMGSRMVINGIGNDVFNPDQAITRAEFAAIMVRGLGLKSTSGDTSFSDVKTTDWFSGAIQTLYQHKLIDGFEDGTFRPTDTITREQAMKIIAQAMVLTDLKSKLIAKESATELKPFTDGNTVAEWAKTNVADVIQAGIVTGRSRTTLAPKANISRAEVAVIIQKLLQKSGLI
ncbi:S-layer homology domain-containing protein [Cohnella sp. OV330]|uniref:S-layer homology domain-containing protein n=1 Tax=Cohnella sp. OV330 TaxID=1855288 RepID=UPI000B7FB8B7|nr:S-layer homology domain-containing protein [Cohnella sp. OV330]